MAKGLAETYATVASHFHSSLATTLTDARHDSVFGLVLYGINLAYAVCISNSHHRVEGRTALRSMVECYIALAFLLKRDQSGLWQKYRSYGSGQAKLAFLKSFDLDDRRLPDYVNVIELDAMANEDAWMEFVAIDVGHWAGADLRRMSEEAGVKEIYDKYYSWPSGYVHGQWGAVRDTAFGVCLNPVHRYHRIPTSPRMNMGSVAPATFRLTNLLLDLLNKAYPTFKHRLSQALMPQPESATSTHDKDETGEQPWADSPPPE